MSLKKCSIDQVDLIHITPSRNLPSIIENGLLPELSEFTLHAHISNIEDELMDSDGEYDFEEAYENAQEELPEMVFVAQKEHLTSALAMKTSLIGGEQFKDLTVLGIQKECESLFEKKEIASDADMISIDSISADCLCELKDWKKGIDQSVWRFLHIY